MQERRALEADVHECRLHSRQYAAHPALVDVARDASTARALDEDFLQDTVFQQGCPRLARIHVDENFFDHAWPPVARPRMSTPNSRSNSAVSHNGSPTTAE